MLHKWWAFVLASLVTVVASPFVAQAVDQGRFVKYEHVAAPSLAEQRNTIWLPPGFDRETRRYPVVYMHDAQNLFDPTKSGEPSLYWRGS